MPMPFHRTFLPTLLLLTAASAQTPKVVPDFCAGLDGNEQSYFPFLYDKTIVQQMWDGAAICTNSALIMDLRMRRDQGDPTTSPGYSIPSLILRLGHSSLTPATMSTTFASNRSGALTQIFSGTYNPPAQLPPAGPTGPFNVVWTLATPFVYTRSQGSLLFEFEITGIANSKNPYYLDAVRTNPAGWPTKYGTSGTLATREAFTLDCTSAPALLVPGGSATFSIAGLKSLYPTLLVLGVSRNWYAPVNMLLPFDLGPFNAPGNTIYASPDTTTGIPILPQGALWGGSVTFPIPAQPNLGAQSLYAQTVCIDPPANGLGLVLSHGLQVVLGTPAAITSIIGASDSTAATGFSQFGSPGDAGGPVVQFTGAFN
jgi:hypothetical protein